MTDDLTTIVREYEAGGSESISLGVQTMPEGYALMRNADGTHYYYVTSGGEESAIHWNKWAVWRWAVRDAKEAMP